MLFLCVSVRWRGDISAYEAFWVHTIQSYIYNAADFEINVNYYIDCKIARTKIQG
jgi:hypothetical protein